MMMTMTILEANVTGVGVGTGGTTVGTRPNHLGPRGIETGAGAEKEVETGKTRSEYSTHYKYALSTFMVLLGERGIGQRIGKLEKQRRNGLERKKKHVKSLNLVHIAQRTTHSTTLTSVNNFDGTRKPRKNENKD